MPASRSSHNVQAFSSDGTRGGWRARWQGTESHFGRGLRRSMQQARGSGVAMGQRALHRQKRPQTQSGSRMDRFAPFVENREAGTAGAGPLMGSRWTGGAACAILQAGDAGGGVAQHQRGDESKDQQARHTRPQSPCGSRSRQRSSPRAKKDSQGFQSPQWQHSQQNSSLALEGDLQNRRCAGVDRCNSSRRKRKACPHGRHAFRIRIPQTLMRLAILNVVAAEVILR